MSADVDLDPELLRAHARAVQAVADRLAGRRSDRERLDACARTPALSPMVPDLERLTRTVERAAGCLDDLASGLRLAAQRAEQGDAQLRDELLRVDPGCVDPGREGQLP